MSESDERLSTDDLAGTSTAGRSASRAGTAEPSPPAAQPGPGGGATDELPSLFPANEASSFLDRWGQVQSRFVDDPKRAVQDGDALVAEVMKTLAASFAGHKADLEGQWNTGDAATDDLRQAFQRYRAFFQRLLSA
jgi:hypothetical protein